MLPWSRASSLLSEISGYPRSHGEPAQVLRYQPNSQYEAHPDFFDEYDRRELANGGQRAMTCLVYLATVPEECGGATHFPKAGLRIQPVEGRAVCWHNTLPSGRVDPRSVHAGELVVRRGGGGSGGSGGGAVHEKWVLSKWVRQRPFKVNHGAFH